MSGEGEVSEPDQLSLCLSQKYIHSRAKSHLTKRVEGQAEEHLIQCEFGSRVSVSANDGEETVEIGVKGSRDYPPETLAREHS